mmetsp:Transcript_22211/g.40875  ORF Transcript_22211/g.40875 Transcript_22211/m.40875 type:complete len:211 (+) Transcript_22211:654-1286(+)
MSAYVDASRVTTLIISPPPFQGGIALNTSSRPHKKPIPVGPHILCPEATKKSTPSSWTSTGMCGTDWQASSRTRAPALLAVFTTLATGLTHPKTLETCIRLIRRVLDVTKLSSCSTSNSPSGVMPAKRNLAPVLCASSCQGTMFEWCSMHVRMTSSPSCRLATPQVFATRLIASVAPLVKTISSCDFALTNRATLSRAISKASVACSART